ncbi:MAG: hypothetical protein ABFR75_07100 [Acidobacteriota bacterium]
MPNEKRYTKVRVLHDFEIKDILYILSRGGWITAKIKSRISPFKGDVDFKVADPEGGAFSRPAIYTKHIDLRAGQEQRVYLVPSSQLREIPFCGRRVSVVIDYNNKFRETNEMSNNIKVSTIKNKNADLSVSVNELDIKKSFLRSFKWRIKFKVHARASGAGYTSLSGISLFWLIKEEGESNYNSIFSRKLNYFSINKNEEKTITIEKKFGDGNRSDSERPRLREGRYIIVVIISSRDDICESNMNNNKYQLTVTLH